MSVETPIEERMSAVEAAVAELRRRLLPAPPDWLQHVVGSLRNEPAFEEVLAYGRELRVADRPQEDNGS